MRRILEAAVKDDPPAKRASFLALAAQLRREAEGRAQTPSEVPIRKDRENGRGVGGDMPLAGEPRAPVVVPPRDETRKTAGALLYPKETRPAKGAKLKEGQPASPPARQPASPPKEA